MSLVELDMGYEKLVNLVEKRESDNICDCSECLRLHRLVKKIRKLQQEFAVGITTPSLRPSKTPTP